MIDVAIPTAHADASPPSRRWVKWLLLGVVLSLVTMWVYAFAFAPRDGVYRVSDSAWRTNANALCESSNAKRAELSDDAGGRITNPTDQQMRQHADLVEQATDIIDSTLDQIEALPLDSPRDREIVTAWLGFYRQLTGDRRLYIERFRNLDSRPFEESEVGGGPIGSVLIDFATGNGIDACLPPNDLVRG